jgi:hypothetical protein
MEGCDDEREAARLESERDILTARLQEPGRDISARAGEIERHSPLFHGTGANPSLFG